MINRKPLLDVLDRLLHGKSQQTESKWKKQPVGFSQESSKCPHFPAACYGCDVELWFLFASSWVKVWFSGALPVAIAVWDSWVSKPEPETGQLLRLHCCSLGVFSDYCFRSLQSPSNQNWFMYIMCVRVCLLYICKQLCGTCTIACTVWVCMMISNHIKYNLTWAYLLSQCTLKSPSMFFQLLLKYGKYPNLWMCHSWILHLHSSPAFLYCVSHVSDVDELEEAWVCNAKC